MFRSGNRRRFMGALAGGAGLARTRTASASDGLRFGTTPVFLDDQVGLLERWQRHLESNMGVPVRFVQRGSYREIIDLLLNGSVDVAWLCGYPYVLYEARLALVSVPLHRGEPTYRSYLIVPTDDRRTERIDQLADTVFAYSDPRSNSGYLVPRVELLRGGHRPDRFFRRTFFTFGHRKVVEAVQVGLARGGAVDGYVWDTLSAQQPRTVAGVRVAWRSQPFGFPPIVARDTLRASTRLALAASLTAMPSSPEGRRLLDALNIDGFADASPSLFDGIRQLVREHARADQDRT